jgi:hypothetical protein
MPIPLTESEFKSFREQLYNEFEHCSDSTMDWLDALCSNIQSPSVVQLSLNPLFRRGYSALYKALGGNLFAKPSDENESQSKNNSQPQEKQFQSLDLTSPVVPIPKQRHFFLFGLDCTSISRPFANTLEDRGINATEIS